MSKVPNKAFQNLDVNWTPQFEKIFAGIPWSLTISLIKTQTVFMAKGVPFRCNKWPILEYRSTTTTSGSFTVKSMEIILQGLSSIGKELIPGFILGTFFFGYRWHRYLRCPCNPFLDQTIRMCAARVPQSYEFWSDLPKDNRDRTPGLVPEHFLGQKFDLLSTTVNFLFCRVTSGGRAEACLNCDRRSVCNSKKFHAGRMVSFTDVSLG